MIRFLRPRLLDIQDRPNSRFSEEPPRVLESPKLVTLSTSLSTTCDIVARYGEGGNGEMGSAKQALGLYLELDRDSRAAK